MVKHVNASFCLACTTCYHRPFLAICKEKNAIFCEFFLKLRGDVGKEVSKNGEWRDEWGNGAARKGTACRFSAGHGEFMGAARGAQPCRNLCAGCADRLTRERIGNAGARSIVGSMISVVDTMFAHRERRGAQHCWGRRWERAGA